jgi:hypothetical protein
LSSMLRPQSFKWPERYSLALRFHSKRDTVRHEILTQIEDGARIWHTSQTLSKPAREEKTVSAVLEDVGLLELPNAWVTGDLRVRSDHV